jgi:ABC-2 type transport system ATP-binding protein
MSTLQIDNIHAGYAKKPVLRDVAAELSAGIHLVRGPNGCGKTTLLSVVAGIHRPYAGSVRFDGLDIAKQPLAYRANLGYVPDKPQFYDFLGGREFLALVARARGLRGIPGTALQWLELSNATAFLDTRLCQMSLGTVKKFFLAAAWMSEPHLLVLDEPFNALDADSCASLREKILEAAEGGAVCLLSDHSYAIEGKVMQIGHALPERESEVSIA